MRSSTLPSLAPRRVQLAERPPPSPQLEERLPPRRAPRVSAVRTLQRGLIDVQQQLLHILATVRENFEHTTDLLAVFQEQQTKHDHLVTVVADLEEQVAMQVLRLRMRDDALAQVHRRALFLEEHIERAEQALQASDERAEVVCLCCYDTTTQPFRCTGGARHAFCPQCVDAQCRALRANPCAEPAREVRCMAIGECDGMLCGIQATEHGDQLLGDFYLARGVEHVLAATRGAPAEEAEVRLALLRGDGTYRGLQCRGCGYGPLWNENCTELLTHHAQRTDGGGQIDNTCPQCGLFVHDTELMDAWDGRRHAIPG